MTPVRCLPPLPERALLADLCRATAARERVPPQVVEKDFYLTRLLWALGEAVGDRALLRGGTLLRKVDLGFRRMSEAGDLVVPRPASRQKRSNVEALNELRDALKNNAGVIGVRMPFPDGQHSERGAHRQWELHYESDLGPQSIRVVASLGPVLRPPRRVRLTQLLVEDALLGSYAPAFCHALDADEARAEKVRAAFTRDAIRDIYDLEQLARAGADLSSRRFLRLVDAKLAELDAPPLREQPASFGAATGPRRRALEASIVRELPAVLRLDEPLLDLDATFARFNGLWRR